MHLDTGIDSGFNEQWFLSINDFARDTPWLHGPLVAYAGYGVVLFGVLLLWGVWQSRRRDNRTLAAAGWACIATLLAVAINLPIASAVAEARPFVAHPGILVLLQHGVDPGFPSDHAVMAGAAAGGLWLVSRRLGLWTAAAAVLLAFSRVYVAAHYPGDVVAGLLLGATVALLGWLLLRVPLIRVTGWLRGRPAVRAVFAPASQVAAEPAVTRLA